MTAFRYLRKLLPNHIWWLESIRRFALLSVLFLVPNFAQADWQISFYSGFQTAPHSDVTGTDPGGVGPFDFFAEWDGRSGENPIYYGIRATYWRTETLGYGFGLNHAKVYLDEDQRDALGFSSFELTDGMNLLTANVFRRWPGQWAGGRLTPYVGAGAGIAIPHVDVESAGGKTFKYQVTGPAVVAMAGISFALTDSWSLFTEYKASYSMHDAELDNGGSFKTNILTNALNLGASFSF